MSQLFPVSPWTSPTATNNYLWHLVSTYSSLWLTQDFCLPTISVTHHLSWPFCPMNLPSFSRFLFRNSDVFSVVSIVLVEQNSCSTTSQLIDCLWHNGHVWSSQPRPRRQTKVTWCQREHICLMKCLAPFFNKEGTWPLKEDLRLCRHPEAWAVLHSKCLKLETKTK